MRWNEIELSHTGKNNIMSEFFEYVCYGSKMIHYIIFFNILRININNTLNQHCHYNSLVHTGGVPVNEPSALQPLIRSPAVWLYPSSQVYVTFES